MARKIGILVFETTRDKFVYMYNSFPRNKHLVDPRRLAHIELAFDLQEALGKKGLTDFIF